MLFMLTVDLSWLEQKLLQHSHPDQQILISYTQQITLSNFKAIIRVNTISPRFIWIDNRTKSEFIGLGKTYQITHSGKDRFKNVSFQIKRLFEKSVVNQTYTNPEIGPRFVGGFSFSGTS